MRLIAVFDQGVLRSGPHLSRICLRNDQLMAGVLPGRVVWPASVDAYAAVSATISGKGSTAC